MKTVVLMFALGGGAFAQTTLNASEDLVRLGIASRTSFPMKRARIPARRCSMAVLYAKNHQFSRVIANPGAYYFRTLQYSGAHAGWDSLSNLTLDFQGSDFYFSNPLVSGIVISNSTNNRPYANVQERRSCTRNCLKNVRR